MTEDAGGAVTGNGKPGAAEGAASPAPGGKVGAVVVVGPEDLQSSSPRPPPGKVGAVVVVGGGVAGIQAALDIADGGFKVYIVEKTPSIGGVMAQLDKTFPTNDCAMCILAPKLVETGRHPDIEIIGSAEVDRVEGEAGNFRVTVRKRVASIEPRKCTACGHCSEVCPVETPSAFDEGLCERKAVYLPFPQAIPLAYTVDKKACIGCGRCATACPAGAVVFGPEETTTRILDAGSIVLAPGFEKFDPTSLKEFGYGTYPNVITSIELERMLNASGPTKGHVLRPSDGRIPKKAAFIQCVGSRFGKPKERYCSAVCCMLSVKEALISQEHTPGLKTTIFFMDLRAFGKDFDEYYKRAESEYGVRFIMWRPSNIAENPATGNLKVVYETRDGKLSKEEFDLVILAAGIRPPAEAKRLASVMGIQLNNYGFCRTGLFTPTETTRKGIFVAGAFAVPQDVPDSVAQSSAAAAVATAGISGERGTLTVKPSPPAERDIAGEPPRIGVFVCRCGINIGGTVDVTAVVDAIRKEPDVAYAEENVYTCAQDSLRKIQDKIKEHKLNRVIVASCTPRTHAPLFQKTIREAGLNAYLFDMANLREQCSWVHMRDKPGATQKAKTLVRMAVAKARLLEPLYSKRIGVMKSALVIGGGISGMTAALEMAAQGFPVTLVERDAHLGGLGRRIHYTLEGEDLKEHLRQLEERLRSDKHITVLTGADIKSVDGFVGNFKTVIEAKPGSDGKGGREVTIEHGAIIVATGGREYLPDGYLYGKDPRVMTQLQFEEKYATGTLQPYKTVVMVQCVGSRNPQRTYCSRVCCTETVKNALRVKNEHPEAQVFILYRDMRTYGFREDWFREARDQGVNFIRHEDDEPPVLDEKDGKLVLTVRDPVLDRKVRIHPDLVTLAVATLPAAGTPEMAQMLKVPLNRNGFFLEAHSKLRPLDFSTEGIFFCGLAHAPKFLEECIYQAQGAVARACTLLSQDELETEAAVAVVDELRCRACGRCEEGCDFKAPQIKVWEDGRLHARINPAMCKGCGKCSARCCSGAVTVKHFTGRQIEKMVEAALEGWDDTTEPGGEVKQNGA
jgi:heterodisulfide reductase subunit A